MYKRTKDPAYLDNSEGRTRLHDAPVLNIPFPNNELFRKSIIFRGSSLWNDLPPDIRNTATFEYFKMKMRENLLAKLN